MKIWVGNVMDENVRSDVQVNLRLPIALKEKIHSIAKQNNRTLNIELTERLINSFTQPTQDNHNQLIKDLDGLLSYYRQTPRLVDISNRLNFVLNESNQIRDSKFLNPSLIAFEMGFDHAGMVEAWFQGRLEPTFNELTDLAKLLGCSSDWLLFGLGKPYPVKLAPSSFNVESLIKFCLETELDFNKVTSLHFVRNDSKEGQILIIKRFNNNFCQVYNTNFHISDIVGNTGREQRAIFVLALLAISKMQWRGKVFSYLLDETNFSKLTLGDEHPLKTLCKFRYLEWMDDIYDPSMYQRVSYWNGWENLCVGISADIDRDEHLLAEKNLIKSKEHQVFSLLS